MVQQDIPLTNCTQLLNFLKALGANFDELCGRTVLLIPIKDWGYAPIQDGTEVTMKVRDWVLVVEEDGNSWIWDGWILEG